MQKLDTMFLIDFCANLQKLSDFAANLRNFELAERLAIVFAPGRLLFRNLDFKRTRFRPFFSVLLRSHRAVIFTETISTGFTPVFRSVNLEVEF